MSYKRMLDSLPNCICGKHIYDFFPKLMGNVIDIEMIKCLGCSREGFLTVFAGQKAMFFISKEESARPSGEELECVAEIFGLNRRAEREKIKINDWLSIRPKGMEAFISTTDVYTWKKEAEDKK